MPTAAGAHAGSLLLGDIAATISPGALGEAIDKVSVSAAGASIAKSIAQVMTEMKVEWQTWRGESGGKAATPKGDGLPSLTDIYTANLSPADLLAGLGPAAQVAVADAAFKGLGLMSGTDPVSPFAIASFLTAMADVPEA